MASLPLLIAVVLAGAASPASAAAADGCSAETFANRAFATCVTLPHLSASLHWTYDNATGSLSVAFSAPPPSLNGWVGWAINPNGARMNGAQSLVAFKQPSGGLVVKPFVASGYTLVQSPIAYPVSALAAEESGDGRFRIFATLNVSGNQVNQVWQVGPSVTNGMPDPHATGTDNLAATGMLNLVSGVAANGGGSAESLMRQRNTHGILNAVSWGLLLPTGAIFARYLKLFADPAWFYMHVTCQLVGYSVGVSGWATGLHLGSETKGITYSTHRSIGIALFALATIQLSALFLRPKKDHKFRVYWNAVHHSIGYTVIILGIVNIFKGMDILMVPHGWKTAYIVLICILAAVAVVLEAVTWGIVFKRRRSEEKHYDGSSNGLRPLSA